MNQEQINKDLKRLVHRLEDAIEQIENFDPADYLDEDRDNPADVSKNLFVIRDHLQDFYDVVRKRTGKNDKSLAECINWIENYRMDKGWNKHGFGGEVDK